MFLFSQQFQTMKWNYPNYQNLMQKYLDILTDLVWDDFGLI